MGVALMCPPCNHNCYQGRDCPARKPRTLWAVIVGLLIAFNLHASDTLEYAAEGALAVDWMQTRYIVQHPWIQHNGQVRYLEESNPVLGQHPTAQKVNLYFPAVMGAQYLAYREMPEQYRPWFAGGTLVAELLVIARNRAIGVSLGF